MFGNLHRSESTYLKTFSGPRNKKDINRNNKTVHTSYDYGQGEKG